MLLTALLAVQATYTAKADTIYSGHYYDNGKEMYSDMDNPHHDDYYCWANAASNMVQYWQDTPEHWELKNNQTTPPTGINVKDGVSPYGTSYLNVYSDFLNSTYNTEASDKSAFEKDLLEWYFKGTPITGITDPQKSSDAPGGYYSTKFDGQSSYKEKGPDAWGERQAQVMRRDSFDTFIKENIDKAGGIVGLDVNRKNPDELQDKQHAITCVGYEIGANGKISSIIVADSDDRYFGTFKLQVKDVIQEGTGTAFVALLTDNKVLKQDEGDEIYFLGRDYLEAKNYVYNLTAISTPGGETAAEDAHTKIGVSKEVMENTRLTDSQELNGSVTVGDGNTVVVLTTDSGKQLTIGGNETGNPALDITRGALVSVDSLEVKDSTAGGVRAVGNLHVGGNAASEDTATFTDNATSGNGGAIENKSFVDISGNDTVVFSGNHANGKGGAIYSQGTDSDPKTYDNTTVSIRGNGTVTFSGNMAVQGGNDIYVEKGAFLNIADNDSVTFTPAVAHDGEAAIVNKGTTYLAAAKDWKGVGIKQTIVFENSSLDSREGTVVIGEDINNQDSRTGEGWYGEVTFTDGKGNTLAITKAASAATLENVLIDATGVYGNADDIAHSLISNVWTEKGTSTGYALQDLTLDTTNHLEASGAITLSNVNIALSENKFDRQENIFNLSSVLVGETLFTGADIFDASGLEAPDYLPTEVKVLLGDEVAVALDAQLKLRLGNYEYQTVEVGTGGALVFSSAQPIVPEPTTGTLSLLALAGLCARRRRKG